MIPLSAGPCDRRRSRAPRTLGGVDQVCVNDDKTNRKTQAFLFFEAKYVFVLV